MPSENKSPFVADVGVAFGAETIVILAIISAIMFSGGAIADFLNRIVS